MLERWCGKSAAQEKGPDVRKHRRSLRAAVLAAALCMAASLPPVSAFDSGTGASWLAAPETPMELAVTGGLPSGTGAYGYTLYRCVGPDFKIDAVTASSNADGEYLQVSGEGTRRCISLFLKRFSTPETECVYVLTENPPPASRPSGSSGSSGVSAFCTLTASAGEGGRITPEGKVSVARNSDRTFTVAADEGYEIAGVLVDGRSVGAVNAYTFEKVAGDHAIAASFRKAKDSPRNPFDDVKKDAWYCQAVEYVYEKGLMAGVSETTFAPDLDTSRGMIVTILWKLEGRPAPGKDSAEVFADVAAGAYYEKAAAWAAETGIVAGCGGGGFGPEDPVTREQLAVILHNHAKYKGMDAGAAGDLSAFSDQPSDWAVGAMSWAVGSGVVAGRGGGILDPAGRAARAETAVMLRHYLERK